MSVPDEEFDDLDFEALEEAVRQSPKGHWFLDEYARRLRSSETTNILQAIAKLERVITSQDGAAGETAQEPGMRPKQLRYFRQDEEMFVETPVQPTATAVAPIAAAPEAPEAKTAPIESRGARLKISRIDQPAIIAPAHPAPVEAAPSTGNSAPAAAQPETTGSKQRIIISRRSSSEGNFIPLIEEAATPAFN